MKIIFLNIWIGKRPKELEEFIKSQISTTDIFCFQEVLREAVPIIDELFPEFERLHAQKLIGLHHNFGQMIYFKNNLNLLSSEILCKESNDPGLGIYCCLQNNNEKLNLVNFHGEPYPPDKLDCEERLKQSETIINFLKNKSGPIIIGGDFNVDKNTKSVEMFSDFGYRELINDFKISTTRNHFAWDLYPENIQYFSDYVFAKNIEIKKFDVPGIEVSDHLPMILEF